MTLTTEPPPFRCGWHSRISRRAAIGPLSQAALTVSSEISSSVPCGICMALLTRMFRPP